MKVAERQQHVINGQLAEIKRLKDSSQLWQARAQSAEAGLDRIADKAEKETLRLQWEAPAGKAEIYARRVCRQRRKQWGDDEACSHDGACVECQQDLAEHFETAASKGRRAAFRELLSTLPEVKA